VLPASSVPCEQQLRTSTGLRPGLTDATRQIGVVAANGTPNVAWRCPQEQQNIEEAPVAKKEKMLEDLFHETLKDIYYAEKKILTALPKMAKAAQSGDLRAAFEKHEGETKDQVERLDQVFKIINQPAKGKTCDAINGIIDESQEVIKEFKGSAALDAGLLASAQAVEHYEISRYGTLKAWAEQFGLQEAVNLLGVTLEEEKKTDEALTELAKAAVNQEAEQAAELTMRR
jgi:ferritin-like metal-binding protein YciE